MKRLVLAFLLLPSIALAQPVPPAGLRVVTHDSSLAGSALISDPLGIRRDCATNEGLKWNGTSWVCGTLGISGSGTAGRSTRWATSSTLGTGAFTDDGTNATIGGNLTINGNAAIGDADNDNHTIKGRSMWTTAGFANGIQNTLTGSSAAFDQFSVRGNAQGTVDTALANRTSYGLYGNANANEASATANLAINVGVAGNASGGEVNNAFVGLAGDARFGTTNGSLSVGYSPTATLPALFSAIRANAGTTAEVALTTSGATSTSTALNVVNNGSFNTTGGALMARGITVVVGATRSAGSNDLTTRAAYFSADAGQVPLALVTGNGGTYLNDTSGSTGIGYAAGTTLPAKLSVTGDIFATTNLQNNGSATFGDASADTVTVNATTTFNAMAKVGNMGPYFTLDQTLNFGYGTNAAADGYINYYGFNGGNTQFRNLRIADGKAADIATFTGSDKSVDFNGDLTKFGAATDGGVYIGASMINFDYGTNAATTGVINALGYQGGVTQFRNLKVQDGKGTDIATFTGSTKAVSLAGGLIVADNVTLGDAGTDQFNVTGESHFARLVELNGPVTVGDAATDTITVKSLVGAASNPPSITSCGTSPSAVGNNFAGRVTVGSGVGTSCVVGFATSFAHTPSCVVTGKSNTFGQDLYISAESAGSITVTNVGTAIGNFNYVCVDMP